MMRLGVAALFFVLPTLLAETLETVSVHQQTAANAMRELAERRGAKAVTVASWFMEPQEWRREGDVLLKEEDDFRSLADNDAFDIVMGDLYFKKALPHFRGVYIDFPHFAVSGRE